MGQWYSRPVLFVRDLDGASRFYVEQLGFSEAWRHSEDDRPLVAQVERSGCELILSCQWPEKAGPGLIFVSLDSGRGRGGSSLVRARWSERSGWLVGASHHDCA